MPRHHAAAPSDSNRGVVWLVAGAFFMELLDSTVIATALPQMAESFHTHPVALSTGISAYMLALAVFIPLSGWIADRFGPRQVFGGARRPFDTKGFVLSGIGCSALMFASDLASHTPFNLAQVLLFGLAGAAAMTLAVRHLRRTPHPLVDLAALKIPTFAVAMWGGFLFRIAINSAPFLLPLMFQLVFGFDATTSGMLLLALFAGNFCMKPGTTWVMRRWGFRRVLLVNGLLVTLGFVACAFLSPTVSMPAIMAVLFFSGMCRSMQFTCLNTISFGDIPSDRMNGARPQQHLLSDEHRARGGFRRHRIVLQAANVLYSSGANTQITDARRRSRTFVSPSSSWP